MLQHALCCHFRSSTSTSEFASPEFASPGLKQHLPLPLCSTDWSCDMPWCRAAFHPYCARWKRGWKATTIAGVMFVLCDMFSLSCAHGRALAMTTQWSPARQGCRRRRRASSQSSLTLDPSRTWCSSMRWTASAPSPT